MRVREIATVAEEIKKGKKLSRDHVSYVDVHPISHNAESKTQQSGEMYETS